ncbi:MAG: quinohemoprotein amine dehydrogenase maturation protein [Bryobacteraceae bacterium]
MTAAEPITAAYRPAEHHTFQAGGKGFVYLVPSGAIFNLEGLSKEIFDLLLKAPLTREELAEVLAPRGYSSGEIEATLRELESCDVVNAGEGKKSFPALPEQDFPLQRIVLNTTNQCNLSCGYCYEYSGDKIAQTSGKPKYMSEEIANASIDTLFREAGDRPKVHVTFFGGETLLNYPVMKSTVDYANRKAAELGKVVDYSLTTNATLLTEEIVDFLAANRFGVTVSMDGDRELHDKMRIFHNGKGSYDIIVPKIKMLLARHKTNSIGARVTLSSGVRHVRRIYEHLTKEIGFQGVGFSPATANTDRLYHIGGQQMDDVLEQFAELAWEYRDFALRGGQHYFTNASDTVKELHQGISKAYTCGAGLGMLGVGTAGDVAICHRFVDAPVAQMGNVMGDGVDHKARRDFLEDHHVGARPDCHECWVRPVCGGGCYHESYIHYGDTHASNLHQCDRVRGWIDTCLQIYGEITLKNPKFLERFDE